MNNNDHENTPVSVPYVVYRDAMAHDRWAIKGLVIALIVTILLLFASNAIWLYYWNQFEYSAEETVTTVDSKGDGIANYTGGDGGVIYGEGNGSESDQNTD